MSKGMVGDNEETSGVTGKLELRFFLPYVLLWVFCKGKSSVYVCADCAESVLPPETLVQGVDDGVPSCADVKCGFLPQQCS